MRRGDGALRSPCPLVPLSAGPLRAEDSMLRNPWPKQKSRWRRRVASDVVPRPPAALVLVSASFDPDGPEVYLTFDRAIDVSGLVVGQFEVDDGPDGHRLVGFEEPGLVAPNEVSVVLQISGAASGADV